MTRRAEDRISLSLLRTQLIFPPGAEFQKSFFGHFEERKKLGRQPKFLVSRGLGNLRRRVIRGAQNDYVIL